jgi:uncharacterized protein (AIM24 family)
MDSFPHILAKFQQTGEGVVVVDAGGGTIDMSSYYLNPSQNWYEAIAPGIGEWRPLNALHIHVVELPP